MRAQVMPVGNSEISLESLREGERELNSGLTHGGRLL